MIIFLRVLDIPEIPGFGAERGEEKWRQELCKKTSQEVIFYASANSSRNSIIILCSCNF